MTPGSLPLKLGKYTLLEELGSGAFGTVYRATDPLGRTVAVKVLKPALVADPASLARFQQEARQAGELFHPHIASILDFDESDGRVFFAMRYVAGESLDRTLKRRGALPFAEAVEIIAQVAEALDYAHARGLVHRDVKPANIILGPEGPVLTDFGLVRAATASGLSTSGAMLGTPAYMAPELWEGTPAGPQTDVYALGCVLYEMLTGQVMFAGDTTPMIMKKHFSLLRLPESWPEGVPAGLGELLRATLAPELVDRPPSAGECVRRLKALEAPVRALQAEPAPSGQPTSESERQPKEPADTLAATTDAAMFEPTTQQAVSATHGATPVAESASARAAEHTDTNKAGTVIPPEAEAIATAKATTMDVLLGQRPRIVASPTIAAAAPDAIGPVSSAAVPIVNQAGGDAIVGPARNYNGDAWKPAPAISRSTGRRRLGLAGIGLGGSAFLMLILILVALAVLMSNLSASRNRGATQAALMNNWATASAPAAPPTVTSITVEPNAAATATVMMYASEFPSVTATQHVTPSPPPNTATILPPNTRIAGPSTSTIIVPTKNVTNAAVIASSTPQVNVKRATRAYECNEQVCVDYVDGATVNLTNNPSIRDLSPSLSPDGTRIVFESWRDGHSQVYLMRSDGSDLINVSGSWYYATNSTWSPNGSGVVFTAGSNDPSNIYVVSVARPTEQVAVTSNIFADTKFYNVLWLPNGQIQYTLFDFRAGGCVGIYIMNADGSNPIQQGPCPS